MHLYFIALAWLAVGATGYTIDTASCNDGSSAISNSIWFTFRANTRPRTVASRFLSENLGCAFELVQQAVNEISGQMSPPVTDLMNALWSPATNTLFPTVLEVLKCKYQIFLRQTRRSLLICLVASQAGSKEIVMLSLAKPRIRTLSIFQLAPFKGSSFVAF